MKKKSFDKPEFNPTKRDYFNLILVLGIFFMVFYFLFNFIVKIRKERIDYINFDYGFVKAKIVDKSVYKGKSLTVVYKVNGLTYKESWGFDNYDYEVGDSIIIKYSKVKPELIIIE